jgi:hypothetical protein
LLSTSATVTVVAAGDIACSPDVSHARSGYGATICAEGATAALIGRLSPTVVLPLGDEQYECGDLSAFGGGYAPTWGRYRSISRPAVGNHEYGRSCHRNDAAGYFRYFGTVAGPANRGWYSYNLGAWHLIALNSECHYGTGAHAVGGCQHGSPQETWLRADLAADHSRCTLAYWHEPRFSSGEHGDAQSMTTIWNDLVAAHVDVVLSGHNHDYERFAPLGATTVDRAGVANPPSYQNPTLALFGIREFVVGTGGKNHYPFRHAPLTAERVRNSTAYGVLQLTLAPGRYTWRFVPVPGATFTDTGVGLCH